MSSPYNGSQERDPNGPPRTPSGRSDLDRIYPEYRSDLKLCVYTEHGRLAAIIRCRDVEIKDGKWFLTSSNGRFIGTIGVGMRVEGEFE